MWTNIDEKQLNGEIKERNRFYKTLLEIKLIAMETSSSQDIEACKKNLQIIVNKCEKTLQPDTI